MADRDDLTDSFLALVDEAFRRLMDEPNAHLHVSGFAAGDVAIVLTREGRSKGPYSRAKLRAMAASPSFSELD
jgi:hypothetical protein